MTRRAATRPPHPFRAEQGLVDWQGRPLCGHQACGLREDRPIHRMPATDPAVAEVEARRLGEREGFD